MHWLWFAIPAVTGAYLMFRKKGGSAMEDVSLAQIFNAGTVSDKAVLKSNPRLSVVTGSGTPTLVVGLPGWGDRAERFMETLSNGLSLDGPYAIATIQDPRTRGPQYQGQAGKTHANLYNLRSQDYKTFDNFIAKICQSVFGGPANVYIVGYSMGGLAAPKVAERLEPGGRYYVRGAIAIGAGTSASRSKLAAKKIRVLFEVAPAKRAKDKPTRSDSANRKNAEYTLKLMKKAGVEAYLLHIPTARRQKNWHWGLISQCRYPSFSKANPQTMAAASTFIAGGIPTLTSPTLTKC